MIFPDEMFIQTATCGHCKKQFMVEPFDAYYRSNPEFCPDCTSRYLIMNAFYDEFVSTNDEKRDFKFPVDIVINNAKEIHNIGSIAGIQELLKTEQFNTMNLTFAYDLNNNLLAPSDNARKLLIQQYNCDDRARILIRMLSPKSFHFAQGIIDMSYENLNFIYNLAEVTYETLYLCYMTDKRPIRGE